MTSLVTLRPSRFKFFALLAIVLCASTSLDAQTLPRPDHVVIVVEENLDFDQIIGNKKADYINALVKEGALLTQFFAGHHPSQPNYFVLFSGATQGVVNDECVKKQKTAPSLGGQLISKKDDKDKKEPFIGYAEGLPSVGFKGCAAGTYQRKHAPWVSFKDVPDSASRPFTDFPTDFTKLPTIAFVIPDMINDMHDGTLGDRIKAGNDWLREKLDKYKEWAKTHNSLLIVTWDEDSHNKGPEATKKPANRIATILVGEMVRPGVTSSKEYTHLDLLRTLQAMYDLPPLPGTKDAIVIDDIWSAPSED